MVVTRLLGGLGNQMFQYAYGLQLARLSLQPLFIDASGFATYDLHALAITNFCISAPQLPPHESKRIPRRFREGNRWSDALHACCNSFLRSESRALSLRRERPFGFAEKYLRSATNVYLDGYWQSERFFAGAQQQLRSEFRPKHALSDVSLRVAERIQSEVSVALHVRRGDYVTNPEARKIYRNLGRDYYRKCLDDLRQRSTGLKVFLFSNDVEWCLRELDVGLPFVPVTHNDATTAYEDLYLMSLCDHAIIANSSFSWWGAFLGENTRGRRVYHPDPWFHPGTLNGSFVPCEDWMSERNLSSSLSARAA